MQVRRKAVSSKKPTTTQICQKPNLPGLGKEIEVYPGKPKLGFSVSRLTWSTYKESLQDCEISIHCSTKNNNKKALIDT
jgi:hypothetical protein